MAGTSPPTRTMLAEMIERLQNWQMRVSLFIDADPAVPADGRRGGRRPGRALHRPLWPSGRRCRRPNWPGSRRRPRRAARRGLRAARGGAGLGVNAGHDLTLDNLPALMQAIPDLDECSIGHALTADALKYGFAETVRRYRRSSAVELSRTIERRTLTDRGRTGDRTLAPVRPKPAMPDAHRNVPEPQGLNAMNASVRLG